MATARWDSRRRAMKTAPAHGIVFGNPWFNCKGAQKPVNPLFCRSSAGRGTAAGMTFDSEMITASTIMDTRAVNNCPKALCLCDPRHTSPSPTMATSQNAAVAAAAPNPLTQTRGRIFRALKSSSQSKSDWLAFSLTTAKGVAAAAECIPFPYVKGAFGTVVVILETVEKVKKNRDDLKELCGNIMDIVQIIQDQLSSHVDTAAVKFKQLCEDLEGFAKHLESGAAIANRATRHRSRFKEVMKLGSTADEISAHRTKIQELRSNFMTSGLLPTQVTQSITKCPPPSRIFHGRQIILDKMHQFFEVDLGKQHIFLLHGLGGSGKTQTALKFIQESSSHTLETIDTGLKNIAATKNVGSTADDALQWLSSQPSEWMLLFDNADDPSIDLHRFFPPCTHGNILITSRNPGLRVYAGSHSLVSDMEELDAVELLLKSASEDITACNKVIAAEIVKALWHLPLAIIQAGAFISKSGVLDKYLDLYKENQAKLLREKPTQSHADYAWTVYTTWQISFDQLSQPAKTLLQLWSFLHHEGITEDLFSQAATYKTEWYPHGPSDKELQEPLEFLSQFLGPDHVWDPLRFIEITKEIRSYSLVNFDPDKKSFSVHPLWGWQLRAFQDKACSWLV
ncbi:P-loop containing nucleoside triphosphate hydrolase protein [Mycena rosella]|uniref:P-loop containing nucleoside triphosphate hydrolase protein n=1 Tax=Mycena rosella TaxID=1033263 RepID=A0AAD7CSW4_MYCRO|nr:P-loop containing nucleoside triphosphate hydrolase protein [Mycena rosella]